MTLVDKRESGQTLAEVVVALAVAAVVILALIIVVIISLKNAQFSQSQSQATKLAQEGIEKVRTVRDRDGGVVFVHSGGSTTKFSDLWNVHMSANCLDEICYFFLDTNTLSLTQTNLSGGFEDLGNGLTRRILFQDSATGNSYQREKKITVMVRWRDAIGDHESELQTILTPKR